MLNDDDEFDAWDEEPDDEFVPEEELIDPEDDDEAEPAPGDFWFEHDDAGDE